MPVCHLNHHTNSASTYTGCRPKSLPRHHASSSKTQRQTLQNSWRRGSQRCKVARGAALGGVGAAGPCVDVTWLQRNLEAHPACSAPSPAPSPPGHLPLAPIPRLSVPALPVRHKDVRVYDARGRVATAAAADPGGPAEGSAWSRVTLAARCSADYDAYLEGHVPGAVFINWVRDGVRWSPREAGGSAGDEGAAGEGDGGGDGGGGDVLAVEVDPDVYVPCFEARGLTAELPAVVYDDGTSMTAAHVWWQLLLYGHPSPHVLLGGWGAWRAAGGKAELYEPCPLKLSTVYDREPQPSYRASREEFRQAVRRRPGGVAEPKVLPVLLVLEESQPQAGRGAIDDLPGCRHIPLSSALLCGGGSSDGSAAAAAGAGGGGGGGGVGCWAAALQLDEGSLAARLSLVLGIGVGRGSAVRLLLASPEDAAVGACAVGVLLQAAGHTDWAVCDTM